MYRALALKAMRSQTPVNDGPALARLLESTTVEFRGATVLLDGEDVTGDVRTLEVGQFASEASVHPEVRRVLVARQKAVIASGGFILEGRDTTTVVAPNAEVKVFLTASIEERARRRWLEMRARGDGKPLQEVVRDVVERDHRDYTRADSPLALAEDAAIVESFGLTPEEVVERIAALVVQAASPVPPGP